MVDRNGDGLVGLDKDGTGDGGGDRGGDGNEHEDINVLCCKESKIHTPWSLQFEGEPQGLDDEDEE